MVRKTISAAKSPGAKSPPRPLPIWAALDSRDAFLSLMKTCAKQAISFWDYLGERLGVPDAPAVPSLAEFIRTLAFL